MSVPRLSKRHFQPGLALVVCAVAGGCAATRTTPTDERAVCYEGPLPDAWFAVWSPPGNPPLVSFHFAPPEDAYYGEVHRAAGHLRFGKGLTFDRARGEFSVHVRAVDMGEPDLTLNVQNAIDMLYGRKFPKIHYDIRSITAEAKRLSFGVATPVVLHGLFRLKGATVPLNVDAVVKPTLDAEGQPILLLTGSFALDNLKNRFDITGPGDPEAAAAGVVLLDFRFPLVPEERSKAIRAEELSQRKPFSRLE